MIRRALAGLFWRFSRWTFVSEPAPTHPTVFVAAPHTSNWDFVLMLAVAWRLKLRIKWLGKNGLFRGWRGPVMRALGGISVDRANPQGLVDSIADMVRSGQVFALVVTPEGTRGAGEYWKSGFYRIARATGLTVTLAYNDTRTNTAGLGPTFALTGNVAADMDRMRAFFDGMRGVNPELGTPPRLRDETGLASDAPGTAALFDS